MYINKQVAKIATSVLLLVGIALFFLIPRVVYKVPHNFSYTADLVAVDNFYDQEMGEFAGEELSRAFFEYETIHDINNRQHIRNRFNLISADGETLFTTEHVHEINSWTWKYEGESTDAEDIHLFAPPGITVGENFLYWHVTNPEPVLMEYQNSEKFHGITVYRYSAELEVDQTRLYGEDVVNPDTQKILKKGNVEILVEPRSGRFVSIADSATVDLIDKETGVVIQPRNHFSNHFERESSINHVKEVQRLRAIEVVFGVIIPSGMMLAAILLMVVTHFQMSTMRVITGASILYIIILVFVSYVAFINIQQIHVTPLRIGIARWISAERFDRNIDAYKQVFFDAGYIEGVDIEFYDNTEGAGADVAVFSEVINSYIEKDVDLIYTMTTPGTTQVQQLVSEIPIVFSVVTHPVEAGLINSMDDSGNNTVGVRQSIDQKKYLELVNVLAPTTSKMLFIYGADQLNSVQQAIELQDESENYNITVINQAVSSSEEVVQATSTYSDVDVVYVGCDSFMQKTGTKIVTEYYNRIGVPMISCTEDVVQKGAIAALTRGFDTSGQLAGELSRKVLNSGLSPSLHSSITPHQYDTHINTVAAEQNGLEIPQQLLLQADIVLYE